MTEPGHLSGALARIGDTMNPVDPEDIVLVSLEFHRRWNIWRLFLEGVPAGELNVSCDYELEQL